VIERAPQRRVTHRRVVAEAGAGGEHEQVADAGVGEGQVRGHVAHRPGVAQRRGAPRVVGQCLEDVGQDGALGVDMTPDRVAVHGAPS
jgi:hypothetical protein